jgi:hypothetical protein
MTSPAHWDTSSLVDQGMLRNAEGEEIEYLIHEGWHMYAAKQCDKEWGEDLTNLLQSISERGYSDAELEKVIHSLSLEDSHWNWLNKSMRYNQSEYHWYYLYADGKTQGVCLIYQPKKSSLSDGNIFYIEFISVAPWNRQNLHRNKIFSGIGTILVKFCLKCATEKLGLKAGFSLHSLPQAEGYYMSLNMQHIPAKDKGNLKHFELPHESANQLLEE